MKKITPIVLLAFIGFSCKKPYLIPVAAGNYNYLVVEGLINTGADSTLFKLSRTVNLNAKTTASPETGALLTVEDNQSNSYPLFELGNGRYGAPALSLDSARKFRLRIKTAGGENYLSDFVAVVTTPPIDSLGYKIQSNGLQFYVNTHSPANNTHYYRWDYSETWTFYSKFASAYKIINDNPVPRLLPQEEINFCWGTDSSSTLLIKSTSGLSQDVVYQNPIVFEPSTSEKLQLVYSILLTQRALTADAYSYFLKLKNNTEQLGGIFDNLPSTGLTGNIHNTVNPAKPAIGYITAGTTRQKRVYINNRNLPAWLPVTFYDTHGCANDTATVSPASYTFYYSGNPPTYLPTYSPNFAASAICVDCTLRGTNKQPKFWNPQF